MQSPWVLTALALTLSHGLFATPTTPAPEDCPSLSTIKSAVVNEVVKSTRGTWVVYTKNQFNTHDNWLFAVEFQAGDVKTEQEAIIKANADLKQFTTILGPVNNGRDDDVWACMYFKDFSTIGFAITPDDYDPSNMYQKFKL